MSLFSRMIFTGFEPNMTGTDVRHALGWLCLPWRWRLWKNGEMVQKVEKELKKFLGSKYCFTIDSGRSALFVALSAVGIGAGDEVLVQGYTCVVVSNAILRTGATPVYVDVLFDFTMDPEDAKKKITSKTKAIIIQHTFGAPAHMDELMDLSRSHHLITIEDCAHSLGASHGGKQTGTMGDIGMFSFGSDKVVSSVRGGALVTNNDVLAEKMKAILDHLPETPNKVIGTHLLHYPIFWVGKLLYPWGIGKIILFLSKKLHLTSWIIEPSEKRGGVVSVYPAKFPNVLAALLMLQLQQLRVRNERRRAIAYQYWSALNDMGVVACSPESLFDSIFLRFPLLVNNPKQYHAKGLKNGVMLGDWYSTVIAPVDTNISALQYRNGSCPNAERLAGQSLNLPTHPGMKQKDIDRVITCIKNI